MVKNILSILLLLVSVFFALRHGWGAININKGPAPNQMVTDLGVDPAYVPFFGAVTVCIGLLLLFPKTFFLGNLLNAVSILLIMALALNAGQVRIALVEIPFLVLPLLLIWLKYPFTN